MMQKLDPHPKPTRYRMMARQWKLIRILCSTNGVRIPDLADELDCNKRTIYRDLEVLNMAGFPVGSYWKHGDRRYRFVPGFNIDRFFRKNNLMNDKEDTR